MVLLGAMHSEAEVAEFDYAFLKNPAIGEEPCQLLQNSGAALGDIPDPSAPGLGHQSKDQLHFDRLIEHVQKQIQPVLKKQGINLTWDINWKPSVQNAFARVEEGQRKLVIYGGLYRNPRLTNDGFMWVLCHELGHHLGGAPMHALVSEISAEGQADYYSTNVCLPIVFEGLDNQQAVQKLNVPLMVKKRCDTLWADAERSAICQRSIMAAQSFARFAVYFPAHPEVYPKVLTPTNEMAQETLTDSYPTHQCRLDTAVAGALCKKELKSTQHFGDVKICSFRQMIQGQGARPRCWFKYPGSNN